ncbi:sulfite exporter TauE/SafE family protein [Parapusillimonas sp. JC17]|uniref:sulfite exporter TauE/SafE family protein n=1 Tax=Parapusillimonas sp. JC17 TaxID=3445768 RepID=UPI003F9F7F09
MESIYIVAVVGAVAAAFVQGLSGFGFGLVAMSIWAWVLEPRLAAALAVFGALTGQVIAAVTVRRGFDLKRLAPFVLGGLLGVPLGVALLPKLDIVWFKAILGALLVVWCPVMLMARRLPHVEAGGRLLDGAVGVTGGIMGGLGGFTGIVPSLWCTLRGLGKDTQRAVIQNFNLSMLIVTMGSYIATGIVTRDMLPVFGMMIPAILVPSLLGARVYIGISENAFRQVVLGLLTASGIAMLAASVPQIMARSF